MTGSPGPGHNPGVDTGRLSSTGHGNGGQDQERDSRSDRGGVSAGPDEQAGEQHEQASASAAAGSYAGQSTGQAGAGLDGGSAGDRSTDVGGDAATVDGQPVLGSTFVADQEQGVTEPGAGQGGEELNEAEPGPGGVVPGAGLEGISGQPDAGTGVIDGGYQPDPVTGPEVGAGPRAPSGGDGADKTGDLGESGGVGRSAQGKAVVEASEPDQQSERNDKGGKSKDQDDPEQKSRDQPVIQPATPDTEAVQENNTSSDASPDQNAEDPLAAMEQRIMQAMEARDAKRDAEHKAELDALRNELKAEHQEELDQLRTEHKAEIESVREELEDKQNSLRNEYEARLDSQKAKHEEEMANAEARIGDLEAKEDERKQEQENSDGGISDASRQIAAHDGRVIYGSDELSKLEPDSPERPDEAQDKALSLAGTFGVVNPVMQMAVSLDKARRDYNEMSPDEKYETNKLIDAYVTASSAMSPGTALLAVTAATAAPVVRDKLHGVFEKLRKKD